MSGVGQQQKTALVSGGSRGIGKGIALVLAEAGYDVAIGHWRDPDCAADVVQQIEQRGRRGLVMETNLADPDTAEPFVHWAIDALGHVDVAVNNAGVTLKGPITSMPVEHMDTLINLNYRSPLIVMRCIGRHMQERGARGNIVNIASTRGIRAYPDDSVYGGLKAALIRSTQSIALEMAPHGIRVNAIAPGAICVREGNDAFVEELGKKIPMGRLGTPADIGRAIAWLVSDAASYITGTVLQIDGGLILPGMPEDIRPEAGYGWGQVRP